MTRPVLSQAGLGRALAGGEPRPDRASHTWAPPRATGFRATRPAWFPGAAFLTHKPNGTGWACRHASTHPPATFLVDKLSAASMEHWPPPVCLAFPFRGSSLSTRPGTSASFSGPPQVFVGAALMELRPLLGPKNQTGAWGEGC